MSEAPGAARGAEQPAPSARQGLLRRHALKLAASLILGAGFVWVMRAGALPLWPDADALARVRWWTVPAYVAIWAAVHLLRAARWHFLLAPVASVPLRRVLSACFIGFLAIVLLPLRAGEMARPVLVRKKGELSGWAAIGTVAAERIIDGLFLSVVLFVALQIATPLEPLPDRIGDLPIPVAVVPGAAYGALGLFALAFVTMGAFYWRRGWARRATERTVGLVSPRLGLWLADRVARVSDGLRFLPRWRYTAPFLGTTAGYWLLNAAGSWLLAWGVGFDDITYAQACVNMGVLALGILLPNAPGFFGQFQLAIYAGFAMYFPASDVVGPGAAYVCIIYLAQLGITVAAAVVSMIVERTGLAEALASLEPGEATPTRA